MRPVLDHPPFPRMEPDGSDWVTRLVLPEWAGFQTRLGPYDAVSSSEVSDGTTRLRVIASGPGPAPPTAAQTTAYQHLSNHGEQVRNAILSAVFGRYPRF